MALEELGKQRGLIASTVFFLGGLGVLLYNAMKISSAANAQMQEHGWLNVMLLCNLCKTQLVAITGYC